MKLSSDHSKVEVTAKIDKSAAGLMVEDAKFWVVEPRVTLSGVSGLGTLLSGNYIGFEVGKSDKAQRKFTGLEVAPIITGGQPGRQFVLKAENLGSLGIGSPIYYRRLQAGQVIAYDLAADGKRIEIKIFVNAPYDKYVNPGTRFWNASGVDASTRRGRSGRAHAVSSRACSRAASRSTRRPSPPRPSPPPRTRSLLSTRTRSTAMKQPDAISAHYVLYFNESLRGLSVGAPVTLLGLPAGEVTDCRSRPRPGDDENSRARRDRVLSRASGCALGRQTKRPWAKRSMRSVQQRHALMQRLVEQRGLRAQLRSGNLLTGQLFVAFDFYPDAPKVKIDWSREVPELPVVPSTVADLEAKITGIVAKLDKLPLEAIGADLTKALASLSQTLEDASKAVNRIDSDVTPELKSTLDGLRGTISAVDRTLNSADATLVGKDAPAQQDLRDALQEIARAARSLRVLTDFLERHPECADPGQDRGESSDRLLKKPICFVADSKSPRCNVLQVRSITLTSITSARLPSGSF